MTVLGLKMARRVNAVSSLHGEVSRNMWTGLYPGKPEDDIPIGHITNGVHVTFLARAANVPALYRHLAQAGASTARRTHLGRHRRYRRRRVVGNHLSLNRI